MPEYTRGFVQYHRMRTRTSEYFNAPMGWMHDHIVWCECGQWEKRFEWKPEYEGALTPARPLQKAHKKHLEAAWRKRSR